MHDDMSLNLDMVEPVAQLLVKNHINGVFVCGTTGESMLLSVEERKIVNSSVRVLMRSLPISGSKSATSTAFA